MKVIEARNVDVLGRVVLPLAARKALDIKAESSVEISVCDGRIIIVKNEIDCKICGGVVDLKRLEGKNVYVCLDCRREVATL